jgi:hypothetical protein
MATNWNITWNDTEWQTWKDDMQDMRFEWSEWDEEDMAAFEDKMDEWA